MFKHWILNTQITNIYYTRYSILLDRYKYMYGMLCVMCYMLHMLFVPWQFIQ